MLSPLRIVLLALALACFVIAGTNYPFKYNLLAWGLALLTIVQLLSAFA